MRLMEINSHFFFIMFNIIYLFFQIQENTVKDKTRNSKAFRGQRHKYINF